jgi:CRISPR-associated endonuclease/helicase Cas3
LPPALVEGLFLAYCDGRQWYQRNRGQRPEQAPAICCLWVDEFDQQHADCADAAGFGRAHQEFAARRQQRLGQQAVRRRAALLPVPAPGMSKQSRCHELAGVLREAALQLHASHHSCDPHSGKRVSFGLIRMAHIDPLVEMALALFALGAPQHTRICVSTIRSSRCFCARPSSSAWIRYWIAATRTPCSSCRRFASGCRPILRLSICSWCWAAR